MTTMRRKVAKYYKKVRRRIIDWITSTLVGFTYFYKRLSILTSPSSEKFIIIAFAIKTQARMNDAKTKWANGNNLIQIF